MPTDANGVPLDPTLAWEAGQKLTEQAAADRTIYTADRRNLSGNTLSGGTRQSFSTANSNLTQALLDVATSTDRDKVINFVRGVDVLDENANGDFTEDREWKLGDIFHSTPVVVTPPFLPSTDASYHAFRTAQAKPHHGRDRGVERRDAPRLPGNRRGGAVGLRSARISSAS